MSETVHYKGTATKVEIPEGLTVEQVAATILAEANMSRPSYWDTDLEYLGCVFDYEYFFYPQTQSLYKITQYEVGSTKDITEASTNKDGIIEYELRYCNGGTRFEEALKEAFDKLNEI